MMALGVAGAAAQDRPAFKIERALQPPRIDGVLDDEAWQREPLEKVAYKNACGLLKLDAAALAKVRT